MSKGRETWPGPASYERLTLADLEALPILTVRDFRIGDVYVKCEKREEGWKVLARYGVPAKALADCLSAPFDKRYLSTERKAAIITGADATDIPEHDTSDAAESIRRIAARMTFH